MGDLAHLQAALPSRYRLCREIGRGGMATVYAAEDSRHGRRVAIKVLHPQLYSAVAIERFKREIGIAAELAHPHIVPLHDSGEADGFLYYVMPLIEGDTLRERLEREGTLAVTEAVNIAQEVADALSFAHSHGILHRDIKPENILLTAGHAMISDFGVARALQMASADRLTESGVALGTPAYMSPEQASGDRAIDGRSDIYSLACVLYEMLAGEPPFTGDGVRALIGQHMFRTAPSLEGARGDLPTSTAAAIRRALSKDPSDRPQTVEEFASALSVDGPPTAVSEGRLASRLPGGRRALLTGAISLLVLTGILVVSVGGIGDPGTFGSPLEGRPRSLVILPFETRTSSSDEASLATELAEELTRQLNWWEGIRAVPSVSLSGPLFDLGVTGSTFESVAQGVAMTRAVGAEALLALTVDISRDSAAVEASLFDAYDGASVGSTFQARGPRDRARSLLEPIAKGILGLEGPPVALTELRRRSSHPEALTSYEQGVRLLERWRLVEAEGRFRQAVALDSTFALARHSLALTLYWQTASDPRTLLRVGPEIARESVAALRHSAGLPWRDSLHIRAFHAFQEGDYDAARRSYEAILGRDATDVYAWLMLGSVEWWDPWLQEHDEGELRPRSDLNAAVHAFSETVRLQPRFDLGYGHLFDIYSRLTRAIDDRARYGFELPRDELLPPWERPTPHAQRAFHPALVDSILWLTPEEFEALDSAVVASGADRLLRESLLRLRRWVAYAPEEAKPHEALVEWTLLQRSRLPEPSAPQRIDSLSRIALEHATRALFFKRDTLPADLVRAANLHLALGHFERSGALVDRALALYADPDRARGGSPHKMIVNGFLSRGQPSRALELEFDNLTRRFIPDTIPNRLVAYGAGDRIVHRMRILGATGVSGRPLRDELTKLDQAWSEGRLPARHVRLLWKDAADQLATALAHDPTTVAGWVASLPDAHPARALSSAEERDRRDLASRTSGPGTVRLEGIPASRAYRLGLLAQRAGDHTRAVALFARLDGQAPRVYEMDVAWGLQSLSYLHRARSYEALADTTSAVRFYERFTGTWAGADSLAVPPLAEALRGLGRLGRPEAARRKPGP